MTADQPLYTIAKEIQWKKVKGLGEDQFLVMMRDLHIEMTFMKCLGNLVSVDMRAQLVCFGLPCPGFQKCKALNSIP